MSDWQKILLLFMRCHMDWTDCTSSSACGLYSRDTWCQLWMCHQQLIWLSLG